jgi:hypothetical protein
MACSFCLSIGYLVFWDSVKNQKSNETRKIVSNDSKKSGCKSLCQALQCEKPRSSGQQSSEFSKEHDKQNRIVVQTLLVNDPLLSLEIAPRVMCVGKRLFDGGR